MLPMNGAQIKQGPMNNNSALSPEKYYDKIWKQYRIM